MLSLHVLLQLLQVRLLLRVELLQVGDLRLLALAHHLDLLLRRLRLRARLASA